MSKLEEAKEILSSLKVPAKQQNGMCCCVLFAMANLTEEETWGSAANIGFGFTMSLRLQTAITEQPMQRIAVKPSANKPCTTSEMQHSLRIMVKQHFSEFLAWETEVWIADMPDHMIHLNGDRFLEPQ